MLIGCKNETYLDGAFAVVYKDNVPYLINKNFETLAIDKYDEIVPEFGEYLLVYNDDGNTREYGYIKNNGKEIIKPQYSSATIFSEGKAIVGLDNKLMIINMQNEVLYTFPSNIHSSKLFSEDMLVVEVDGKFGNDTKNAVVKFQKLFGLKVDGCVGRDTWKKILGVK
jgi:peptidoglycan hydrolase-like protein with peptidoglycan-binding domain